MIFSDENKLMCLLLFNIFIVLDVFKYIISIFLFVSFNIIEPIQRIIMPPLKHIFFIKNNAPSIFIIFFLFYIKSKCIETFFIY